MSTDPMPEWSPDAEIASLLKREREDSVPSGVIATGRLWHRLEMHAVGAAATGAATAAIATVASGIHHTEAASGAAGAGKALAWKIGAASLLLLAGGAIGASVQARLTPGAPTRVTVAPTEVIHTAAEAPTLPVPLRTPESESAVATVDVESLPRVLPLAPAVRSAPAAIPSSGSVSARSAPPASASASPTSLGEEQRLLDTARAAVARGAYSSALGSLTEHQTRFPSGRLTEERELLFVQALAGVGATSAAQARARDFAERFPGSIFLPAVRAASASQER